MPGSMDGMKLARFVGGRWPPIQIVATSGFVNVGKDDLPGRQSLSAKALPPGANEKTRLTAAEAAKRKPPSLSPSEVQPLQCAEQLYKIIRLQMKSGKDA
jgi:hypothetical protein